MAGAVRRGDGVYIVHTIDCYRGHRFECRVWRGELSLWRGLYVGGITSHQGMDGRSTVCTL